MTDAECNFSYDAREYRLVVGAHIKVTKIEKKVASSVEVGHSVIGHICQELQLGVPLYFSEYHNQKITSELERIFMEANHIFIETRNSIYEVTFY